MEHCQLLLTLALGVSLFNGCQVQGGSDFKRECGTASFRSRVVGGAEVSPGSWPWIVSLSFNTEPFCGGSLISELWVLTAAHCLETPGTENYTTAYLGRHTVSNLNNTVSRSIESAWCHPQYNQTGALEHDICLLKLSAPVAFTDHIRPVCLAARGSTFPSGLPSWVAGWGTLDESGEGFPEALQEVMLPIVGINECRCLNMFYVPENSICAGYSTGGRDSCQGDSGGPHVIRMGRVWVQAGIVSFGEGCGRQNRPGVYTLVPEYQDWISEVVGDASVPGFSLFDPPDEDSDLEFDCENKTDYYNVYYRAGATSGAGDLLISLSVLLLSLVMAY